MAIKAKVSVNFNIDKSLQKLKSDKVLVPIAREVLSLMKDKIYIGYSPVKGEGRFIAYSAQRNNVRPKKSLYPYNVQKKFPDKRVRPVNLKLSGQMLQALTYKIRQGAIILGIFDAQESEKAQRHQVGDPAHGLPKRRFLPTKSGEEFIVSIQREIKDLFVRAIDQILK